MIFRDDKTGWDATAIAIALMLLVAPIAMTYHMAHRGQDPAGPDPRYTRGSDMIQFWVGAAVLESGERRLYDADVFARAFESVERANRGFGFGPTYPPPIYQLFDVFEGLGQLRATKLLLWTFLLVCGVANALLLRAAGHGVARGTEVWLLLWAAPAAQLGVSTGQPAALWLASLGLGLALWRAQRDLLAGIALGVLCMKPTLAAPVALALLLAAQWRALAGFVLGGAGVLAASIARDGFGLWASYLEMLTRNPDLPQQLWSSLHRHFSFRSLVATPLAGGEWAAPAGVAGGIAALAFALWLRGKLAPVFARDARSFPAFALLLGACSFATPHLLDYDLVLYFPLMIWAAYWLAEHRARRKGLGLSILVAFYLVPIAYPISEWMHFSLGSLVLLLLLGWSAMEISTSGECGEMKLPPTRLQRS